MPEFEVVVIQRVRYTFTTDAESWQEVQAMVESGMWPDDDNSVLGQVLTIRDDEDHVLLHQDEGVHIDRVIHEGTLVTGRAGETIQVIGNPLDTVQP